MSKCIEIVCNSDYDKRGAFRALCVDDLLEKESIEASGKRKPATDHKIRRSQKTPNILRGITYEEFRCKNI